MCFSTTCLPHAMVCCVLSGAMSVGTFPLSWVFFNGNQKFWLSLLSAMLLGISVGALLDDAMPRPESRKGNGDPKVAKASVCCAKLEPKCNCTVLCCPVN